MHRGECVTTGGLYRPTHLCVAHLNCTKKVHSFFFGVVRLGGVLESGGGDDLCSRVHCPLEGLAVSSTAVPVPDSDTAGQHTLNGAPVECGEDGWWETCSFQPA